MKLVRYILFAVGLLFTTVGFSQPWIKKPGEGFAQVGASFIKYQEVFFKDIKTLKLNREIMDVTTQAYAEVGLPQNFMIVANAPYKFTSSGSELTVNPLLPDSLAAGSLSGLGNVTMGLAYGFAQKGTWKGAVRLDYIMDAAVSDTLTGLRTGYSAAGIYPSIHVGRSFDEYFITANTGVNFRTNNYSTQLINNFQIGKLINNEWYVILWLEFVNTMEDGSFADEKTLHTGLHANDQEYAAFNLKFGYKATESLTAWASLGGGLGFGHMVAAAPALSFAISYQWEKAKKD